MIDGKRQTTETGYRGTKQTCGHGWAGETQGKQTWSKDYIDGMLGCTQRQDQDSLGPKTNRSTKNYKH